MVSDPSSARTEATGATPRWWLPPQEHFTSSHRLAFRDWAACAFAGGRSHVVAHLDTGRDPEKIAFALATRSHVLDFDDTYPPGLAHLSSPTAASALAVGSQLGAKLSEVASAHARAFEFMAQLTRSHHPHLYERGWHPTSVCGAPAAAVAAGTLLDLHDTRMLDAVRFAMLQAGGLQASFGSPGKALQVGMAAQTGVRAAFLAAGGLQGPRRVDVEWEAVYGCSVSDSHVVPSSAPLVRENWIKAYPCCLQTHTTMEAAAELVERVGRDGDVGPIDITVHPLSLQAAPVRAPREPLETKFSIPYLAAFVLVYGRMPSIEDLDHVHPEIVERSRNITVQTSPELPQATAVLRASGSEIRCDAALGSPDRPMGDDQHAAKVASVGATEVVALLDEADHLAGELVELLFARGVQG